MSQEGQKDNQGQQPPEPLPVHPAGKTAITNIEWLLPTYGLNSSQFNNGKIDVINLSLTTLYYIMFTYPTLLISYVYTVRYSIYCILPS